MATEQETVDYIEDCFEHLLWEHPSQFDKVSIVSKLDLTDTQWAGFVFSILRVHDRTCDVKLIEELD